MTNEPKAKAKLLLANVDPTTLRDLEAVLDTVTFPVLINFSRLPVGEVVELNDGKQRLDRGLYARLPVTHPINERANRAAELEFLQQGQKAEPEWDREAGFWSLTRGALGTHLINAVERYGACWIVQTYNEKEVCAAACQNAKGDDCDCAYGGEHHRAGDDGSWHHITEICAVRAGPHVFAIRLQESSVSPEELACRAAKKRQSAKSREQLRREEEAELEVARKAYAAKMAAEAQARQEAAYKAHVARMAAEAARREAERAAVAAKWKRIEAEAEARVLTRKPTVKSAVKEAFSDSALAAAFFDDL